MQTVGTRNQQHEQSTRRPQSPDPLFFPGSEPCDDRAFHEEETMSKKARPKQTANRQPRAVSYVVDMEAGEHQYVFLEGVGECRAHFQKLVEDLERGVAEVVVVAKASLLYVDTSPMWMEKFIATVKRRGSSLLTRGRSKSTICARGKTKPPFAP
jgi:hypothetical protein